MQVAPLTREHAVDICTWRFAPPYECYDMQDADPDWLLQPEAGFHALLADNQLIGFRSFGADGQVPGWTYDDQALYPAEGLRPQLVGQGSDVMPSLLSWRSVGQSSRPRHFA